VSRVISFAIRDLEAYPLLIERGAFHMRPPSGDRNGALEFGLDLVLDGLQRADPADGDARH